MSLLLLQEAVSYVPFAAIGAGLAAIGAGIGAVAGGVIGAATSKDGAERKALKAKVKAGKASPAEKAKLAELQKSRRNRILKATAGGAVAGGVVGAGYKGGKALVNNAQSNMNSNKRNKATGSKYFLSPVLL